jgi:hypothetical protein
MTILTIILAVYAALMTYLKLTAAKTETKVDDKILEVGEKVAPIVELIKDKTAPAVVPTEKK